MKDTQIQLDDFRESKGLLAFITYSLLACMLFVFYSPSALAFKHTQQSKTINYDAQLAMMKSLQQVQDDTRQYLQFAQIEKQQEKAADIYQSRIKKLHSQLDKERDDAEQQIRAALQQAIAAKDKTAIKMQGQLLTALLSKYTELELTFAQIDDAKYSAKNPILVAAKTLDKQLAQIKFGKSHHQYDGETMPFGPNSDVVYKPAQTLQDLLSRLKIQSSHVKVQEESLSAAFKTSGPDYLALNIDTASTQRLVDLAASLNSDPLSIYQYVYNNIEYVPAHGSIQGADYTDQTQRGGAMDQASLLISLLRLSNIEARYVYGSVTLPINDVMNWVGGVEVPAAAQNILGQGGVPNTLILNAQGEPQWMNLEHVWVEAKINDSWVALDPSYKQYEYTDGINLDEVVQLDGSAFVGAITEGADINEQEGWVQNINQTAVQTQLSDVQSQIENYIAQQYPDATVADVLGSKTIIASAATELPANLPYAQVIARQGLAELPSNLRHKFGFTLQGELGSSYLSFELRLPELAGKRLSLAFEPATESDQLILDSKISEQTSSLDQISQGFSYGEFNVLPQVIINDISSVSGSQAIGFGTELEIHMGLWVPRFGWEKKLVRSSRGNTKL